MLRNCWVTLLTLAATHRVFVDAHDQFSDITLGDRRLRCYTCATVNGSHIVAGAGVDPGVFLSTIPLGSLPVTHRCADPFDAEDAIRAGVVSSVCEDGLCVKINYTDKWTSEWNWTKPVNGLGYSQSQQNKCYSCTTPYAEATLRGVQDKDWQRWLNSVRSLPRSPTCTDPFDQDVAVRAGALLEDCEKGVCMKMWFRERKGSVQIWRTCIPKAQGVVRTDCTKITSSEGDMEVCTCDGHACNGAPSSLRSTCIWANNYFKWFLIASSLFHTYQLSHHY